MDLDKILAELQQERAEAEELQRNPGAARCQISLWWPALTPQEAELLATVIGLDPASIAKRFPSELMESIAETILSSSPEMEKYYNTAGDDSRARLRLRIQVSVFYLWSLLLPRSEDACRQILELWTQGAVNVGAKPAGV